MTTVSYGHFFIGIKVRQSSPTTNRTADTSYLTTTTSSSIFAFLWYTGSWQTPKSSPATSVSPMTIVGSEGDS